MEKSLKIQDYLLTNNFLTLSDQQEIFSLRCRMNQLYYNFPGNKVEEKGVCGIKLTDEHLYSCNDLRGEHINEESPSYDNIFNGSISEQSEILKIVKHTMKIDIETTQ